MTLTSCWSCSRPMFALADAFRGGFFLQRESIRKAFKLPHQFNAIDEVAARSTSGCSAITHSSEMPLRDGLKWRYSAFLPGLRPRRTLCFISSIGIGSLRRSGNPGMLPGSMPCRRPRSIWTTFANGARAGRSGGTGCVDLGKDQAQEYLKCPAAMPMVNCGTGRNLLGRLDCDQPTTRLEAGEALHRRLIEARQEPVEPLGPHFERLVEELRSEERPNQRQRRGEVQRMEFQVEKTCRNSASSFQSTLPAAFDICCIASPASGAADER